MKQTVNRIVIDGVFYDNVDVLSEKDAKALHGENFKSDIYGIYWPTDKDCTIPLGMVCIVVGEEIPDFGLSCDIFLMQKQEYASA